MAMSFPGRRMIRSLIRTLPAEALHAQSLDFMVVRVENRTDLSGSQRFRAGDGEAAPAGPRHRQVGHSSDHQPDYERIFGRTLVSSASHE